jgi:Cu(I)/Ag(I) efflux system membrane protein CusA/SilA
VSRLGGEFLPPLDEGDLLYMPTALPGLSAGKAAQILQQTDRMIRMVPEVASVFGKIGRAETATDPAPLEMIETTIRFKPREQWRAGMTMDKLVDELDRTVRVPGSRTSGCRRSATASTCSRPASRARSASRSPGPILRRSTRPRAQVEAAARTVPGVSSALAERLEGGRYVDVTIDRAAAARYGLSITDIQDVIGAAVGGENVAETIEGLARFPVSVALPARPPRLDRRPADAADRHDDGRADPALGRGERAHRRRPADAAQRERAAVRLGLRRRARPRPRVGRAGPQAAVAREVRCRPATRSSWSGQFEFLERAKARLAFVVPLTLLVIFVLLYLRSPRRRGAADHARGAVRARRRVLAAVAARLRDVGRDRGRLHRAGRRRGGVRRRDAALPAHAWEARLAAGEPATEATLLDAIARARCCACGPRR